MFEVGTRKNSIPTTTLVQVGFRRPNSIGNSEYRWSAMGSRGSSSCGWTNERHVDFLNSMEASFVRTILQPNFSPPLDRYLADSSDSTLDLLNTQRRRTAGRRHSTSDILDSTRIRIDKRNRRLSHQPYNISSQDQVVPHFESRKTDDSDTDKKDHQLDVVPAK